MKRQRTRWSGRGRIAAGIAAVIAAAAGVLITGASGAGALPSPAGAPGQWSMAGQNISDTHLAVGGRGRQRAGALVA